MEALVVYALNVSCSVKGSLSKKNSEFQFVSKRKQCILSTKLIWGNTAV
jgi:hypothetical protein